MDEPVPRKHLPLFLHKILIGKTIENMPPPSQNDVNAMVYALEGKEPAEITHLVALDYPGVLAGIKRVRDWIRQGHVPDKVKTLAPKMIEWQQREYPYKENPHKHREPNIRIHEFPKLVASNPTTQFNNALGQIVSGIPEPPPPTLITDSEIEDIEKGPYREPDPNEPDTLGQFLFQVKSKAAVPGARLALRRLVEQAKAGDAESVDRLVTFFWGRAATGASINQQFNFGGGRPKSSSGLKFEEIIKQAEAQDQSGFGMGGQDDVVEIDAEVDEEPEEA